MLRLRYQLMSTRTDKNVFGIKGKEADLQTGQVPLDFNHGMIHDSWKGCLHGNVTTICSSGSSVSSLNCSLHTAQSFSSIGAGREDLDIEFRCIAYSHPVSSTSRGRFSIMSSEAATGREAFEYLPCHERSISAAQPMNQFVEACLHMVRSWPGKLYLQGCHLVDSEGVGAGQGSTKWWWWVLTKEKF